MSAKTDTGRNSRLSLHKITAKCENVTNDWVSVRHVVPEVIPGQSPVQSDTIYKQGRIRLVSIGWVSGCLFAMEIGSESFCCCSIHRIALGRMV